MVMDTTPRHQTLFKEQSLCSFQCGTFQYFSSIFLLELFGCIYSILNVQNINRPRSKSQTFENQLEINEHISEIILNSLCHSLFYDILHDLLR